MHESRPGGRIGAFADPLDNPHLLRGKTVSFPGKATGKRRLSRAAQTIVRRGGLDERVKERDQALDGQTQDPGGRGHSQAQDHADGGGEAHDLEPAEIERWLGDGLASMENRSMTQPRDVRARYERKLAEAQAQIRAALGERGSALHAAKRAVDLAPDDARAWSDVGRVHAMFGEGVEAIAAFQRAVGMNEGDADGWHDLGAALQRIGIRCAPTTLLALSPPSIPRPPTPRRSLRSTVIMAPTSSSNPRSKPTSSACRRENSLQMSNFYVQQYHG